MMIRQPVRAGTFYPENEELCRRDLLACVTAPADALEGLPLGGIVPHAGWRYSGRVAGRVFSAIAATHKPSTVVLLGAIHAVRGQQAALFASGCWETPIGPVEVDSRLGERVLGHTNLIVEDAYAHENEHSLEVQVPFIRYLMPTAKILPILVPPSPRAVEIGQSVARTLATYRIDAVVVGSTDLTHYGPNYDFTPQGAGPDGLTWAKEVNDGRMIQRMLALDAPSVVPEAAHHRNACGSGAVAATLAALREMGADRAVLLEHTTSREVSGHESDSSAVGYAGLVFLGSAPRDAAAMSESSAWSES